jgi:3-isopropylmalate/(R)-2-methylmalate dehydratase small subunit
LQPFNFVSDVAAALPIDNVNTDAIIPVRWIVNIGQDLGKGLFGGWRYRPDETENPDFVLNLPPFRNSRILVSGANFGCGSSREEAVWALMGFGIRCVIAPSFGDIFFENSFKNGLLPIVLDSAKVSILLDELTASATHLMTVDLERCVVEVLGGTAVDFAIDTSRRQALLDGLDEIDQTLARAAEFAEYRERDRTRRPWIYDPSGR